MIETIPMANILKKIRETYEGESWPYRRRRIHQYLIALPSELDISDPAHA